MKTRPTPPAREPANGRAAARPNTSAGPGPRSEPAPSARARVRIAGEDYVVRASAPPEYIERVAEVVDAHMRAVQEMSPNLVRHRQAILAALNLAHELERLRRENQDLRQLLDEARA